MMSAARWNENRFSERGELFAALAGILAGEISAAPQKINIALAGGETPKEVYRLLQGHNPPWEKVNFYPTDERCVAEDSPRRNSAMLRQCLGSDAAICSIKENDAPPRLDIALLGMGEDGHIASLFPGEQDGGENVYRVSPQSVPEERLTIPMPAFVNAEKVFLLFCGEKKWSVFMRMDETLPVAQLVAARKTETEIFYAP